MLYYASMLHSTFTLSLHFHASFHFHASLPCHASLHFHASLQFDAEVRASVTMFFLNILLQSHFNSWPCSHAFLHSNALLCFNASFHFHAFPSLPGLPSLSRFPLSVGIEEETRDTTFYICTDVVKRDNILIDEGKGSVSG